MERTYLGLQHNISDQDLFWLCISAVVHLVSISDHVQVICGDMELKIQPYEWVYDGLKPLFLDSVFDIKKGIHISLAALYCAVGRRLECPLLPELASRGRMPLLSQL